MSEDDVSRIEKNQREILDRLRSLEVAFAVTQNEVKGIKKAPQNRILNPWWSVPGSAGGGAAIWEFLRRFGGE